MAQTTTLQVTLSEEAFEFVRKKVASGEFASPSEVLARGIELMRDYADEQARWEQEIAIPAFDRMKADPSRRISLEDVERHFAGKRRLRSQAS